jgi:hypothetical protein
MQDYSRVKLKRAVISILIAWLLFIGVDFLFHASVFASFWKEDIPAFKPLINLALLIPAGYLSFLLLTVLIGYMFFKLFKSKPHFREVLKFALIFGMLFSLSNLFGSFSYINIPIKHLIVFNFIYLIEVIMVTLSLYYLAFSANFKKNLWSSILIFMSLIIIGIVIQNVS